jgi:uncharacterized protein (TIGR02569 family)
VRSAFGAHAHPVRLPGGQGSTWRAGDLVLKPAGLPDEAEWVGGVLSTMDGGSRFRTARPVTTAGGAFTASGWSAWRFSAGEPDPTRVADILRTATAFHAASAGLSRPAFLDVRDDPWAYADRVAWGEQPVNGYGAMGDLLTTLSRELRHTDLPDQVVHGDLAGNVLFSAGLPPAIIDWSVYHRPAAWASAVVVIDAVTWHEVSWHEAINADLKGEPGRQMLLRALLFRIATNEGQRRLGNPVRERPEDYRRAVEVVLGHRKLR